MRRFLITYHGVALPEDPAQMRQGEAAFGRWVAGAGDAIVDPGAPLQMVTQVARDGAAETVEIVGYTIIQANDGDAAAAVLSSHPWVARGGTLQVNQILEA